MTKETEKGNQWELLEGESSDDHREAARVYSMVDVRVEKVITSIQHLKKLVEESRRVALASDFFCNGEWGEGQAAELVEMVLLGIPLPAFYLLERKDGSRVVVDGFHRVRALLGFLNNQFRLQGLKWLPRCNGQCFADLDRKMQGLYEDFLLTFYVIQPPTPEWVKYAILDRVNY